MTPSLETKLGAIINHVEDHRSNRIPLDTVALDCMLDDREVAEWLTAMRRYGALMSTFYRDTPEALPRPMHVTAHGRKGRT